MPATTKTLCVYTCMMGRYERLNEQSVVARSRVPFLCLTDDPALTSTSWTIQRVQPAFEMDPIRSQRVLKLMPHEVPEVAGFDYSLYIDNSILLKVPPEDIVDRLGWGTGVALPRHSYRESILDEFIEVARIPADDPARVYEQLNHYLTYGEPTLQERPYWSGIMLRRHGDPLVQAGMRLWCTYVLRYSRRDQLSANLAFRRSGLTPQVWEIDCFESWFHSWPHRHDHDRDAGPRDPLASITPPVARLRQLEMKLADSEAGIRMLGTKLADSEGEIRKSEGEIRKLEAELTGRDYEITKLSVALMDIRSSTSWKLTWPLRFVADALRR